MVELAASAKEQATGLGEVNAAVNQMDQVTQQNAAMVEQATAASHSLSGEAEELARLVGQFRIGESVSAPVLQAGRAQGAAEEARRDHVREARSPCCPATMRRSTWLANAQDDWSEF